MIAKGNMKGMDIFLLRNKERRISMEQEEKLTERTVYIMAMGNGKYAISDGHWKNIGECYFDSIEELKKDIKEHNDDFTEQWIIAE